MLYRSYQVIISRKKANELQEKVRKLKHPVRLHRDVKNEYSLAYLNMPTRYKTSMSHPKIFKTETTLIPIKKINYLADLKKKRFERYNSEKTLNYDLDSDLYNNDMSITEKYLKICGKLNEMERYERMQEHLMGNIKEPNNYLDKERKASDLLLKIAKEKLAILDLL